MIKNILTAFLLLFPLLSFCQTQKAGINFISSSWNEAAAKAKSEHKPIFVYAYSTSCHFCRQMEKEVFPAKEVSDYYNSKFVSYKINIEDGAGGEALAKQYNIEAYPTYIYFDENAKIVHQSGSGKSAEMFILDGENSFNPQKALFTLKNKYDNGDRSSSLLYDYSNALTTYHVANSPQEKVVNEYLSTQTSSELESEKNLQFIFLRYLNYESATTQYFLKNQNKFSKLFPPEDVDRKAIRIISNEARTAGRENKTVFLQELNTMIRSYFTDSTKALALTDIYYSAGKKDWIQYAKSTFKYSNLEQGASDWQTMHETSAYLNLFSKDPVAFKIGADLMAKVNRLHKNYENLCLYAKLQNKSGKPALALNTAQEALKAAKLENEDGNEAKEIIAEIKSGKKS